MKLILGLALMASTFLIQAAQASDVRTESSPESQQRLMANELNADWQCTTHSFGRAYDGWGWDQQTPERQAVTNCISAGGDRVQCSRRVVCHMNNQNPPPPPYPPPYPPPPPPNYYYDWGQGQDGFGYCYEWTGNGQVLNGGQPVPNDYCEATSRSYYTWGRGQNGYTYCYHFTGRGTVMDHGQAAPISYCQ